ncbi:hypothetical protein AB5J52_12970 [Streptomyces sp. R39]|uniref:DUF4232 domain-containing protein n=1 Tax=Streptomyces sp. R39 TaxID=3238631 RepID=A0AB39QIP0_9ACTN
MNVSRPARPRAVAVAAVALLAAGCSGYLQPTPRTLLTSGVYQGESWSLYAWQQDGQLCMEVDGPGDPTASGVPSAGACGFDQKDPSSGYYASGPGPGDSDVNYGPLPSRATQIRVATKEILPAKPFPAGRQLPAGRFWIQIVPEDWPVPADGRAITPEPLNASGRRVAYQDF